MNTVKWNDGSKVSFQNLNSCMDTGAKPDYWYVCKSGYATISNPMGTKICDLTIIQWNKLFGINYTTGSCRYK